MKRITLRDRRFMNCRLATDEQQGVLVAIQWSRGTAEIYTLLPMFGTKSGYLRYRFFLSSLSRFLSPHSYKKQAIDDQEKNLASRDKPFYVPQTFIRVDFFCPPLDPLEHKPGCGKCDQGNKPRDI